MKIKKQLNNQFCNYFKCSECSDVRISLEDFITIPILQHTLEETILNFLKKEEYNLECDKCKKITHTFKQTELKSLGNIIIFHNVLKKTIKFNKNICFKNKKYVLTGFIKHFGSQNFGHYIYINYINNKTIDDLVINDRQDNVFLIFIYFFMY